MRFLTALDHEIWPLNTVGHRPAATVYGIDATGLVRAAVDDHEVMTVAEIRLDDIPDPIEAGKLVESF